MLAFWVESSARTIKRALAGPVVKLVNEMVPFEGATNPAGAPRCVHGGSW